MRCSVRVVEDRGHTESGRAGGTIDRVGLEKNGHTRIVFDSIDSRRVLVYVQIEHVPVWHSQPTVSSPLGRVGRYTM